MLIRGFLTIVSKVTKELVRSGEAVLFDLVDTSTLNERNTKFDELLLD